MTTLSLSRRLTLAAVTGALFLAGCGGGGGTSASVDDIVNQLGKEPEFAAVKAALPAKQYDKVARCIAEYLHDKGKGSDVDDWIAGKKKLAEVRGSDSEENASAQGGKCIKEATGTP